MTNSLTTAECAGRKLSLWFFRELSGQQRGKLFSLFGMTDAMKDVNHAYQAMALAQVVRAISAAAPTPQSRTHTAGGLADMPKVNGNAQGSEAETSATRCLDDPNSDPKNENIQPPQDRQHGDCPCGDNDGLWCSLGGCPYPKPSPSPETQENGRPTTNGSQPPCAIIEGVADGKDLINDRTLRGDCVEPPTQIHVEGLSDEQVEAVLHLVESRLCIVWAKVGAREEFANQLRVLEPAPEEERETCEACGDAFEDGDLVYWLADDTGHIHADCCGPERESYVGEDGEPLKDGDPIPEPFAWKA